MPIYKNFPKITGTQVCHASDCVNIENVGKEFRVQNFVPIFTISQARITAFKFAFIDFGTKYDWKEEISTDSREMEKSWKIKRLTAEISSPLVFT